MCIFSHESQVPTDIGFWVQLSNVYFSTRKLRLGEQRRIPITFIGLIGLDADQRHIHNALSPFLEAMTPCQNHPRQPKGCQHLPRPTF